MIDNLKGQEELEVKKLKVTKADIVVRGTIDKPYYVIVYHEVGKDYDNEGFGSYYLENVFKWRNEELEIVDEKEQPQADKWILCSDRLPEEYGEYLCCDKYGEYIIGYPIARVSSDDYYVETEHEIMNDCIAWQPLPTPYKPGSEG